MATKNTVSQYKLDAMRKSGAITSPAPSAVPNSPAGAPLSDVQLGALATATQPAPVAAVPTPAPSVPQTVPSPATPVSAQAAAPVTDPTRATLSASTPAPAAVVPQAAPTVQPVTAVQQAVEQVRASQNLTPGAQAAAEAQRRILELHRAGASPTEQAAAKAAYNQAYLGLSSDEKLAVLKATQAPSSASKLAGVRNSSLIGASSGNATLSDEQLANVAIARLVTQQAGAQNDAEVRAALAAVRRDPVLFEQFKNDPSVTQFVQDSTANLSPDLAQDRLAQQAATQASTAAEIARRQAEGVIGTNLGGGNFVGGVQGLPDGTTRPLPSPPPLAPTVETDIRQTALLAPRTGASLGLTREQQQAQAAGLRAEDQNLINLARSLTPPGRPLPETLEEAQAILAGA